ncbi:MAG: hypothetical protein ACRDKJ_00555 [Actinomycetota bacterium]
MPWCPRCDEVFPEGPACPRCSARLVDRGQGWVPDDLQAEPDFPMIKVSRRDRRALERLSGPKAPSSRVVAVAVATLVFAVGFLVGRIGSLEQVGPSVRALPPAQGLAPYDVEGSAVYLLWTNEPLATIALQDVYSGDVVPRARLSPPVDVGEDASTKLVAHSGSIAMVLSEGRESFVAFAPAGRSAHGWVDGVEAAWAAPDVLLVRERDGSVVEWSVRSGPLRSRAWGKAERLFQTPTGAVALRAGRLIPGRDPSDGGAAVPDGVTVLASDGRRMLAARDGDVVLIDGGRSVPLDVQGFEAVAAGFETAGDRVAVVLSNGRELTVAVADGGGKAALKPLRARVGDCVPTLTWDLAGKWLYVGAGDGVVRAVDAAGSYVEPVRTKAVGCGLAWID